ncbi:MAG: 50S ribosomal protein L25 [Desulfobacterales bacterium]|nr:50S ribosomal protein L25 [Desulfobacterales bacterium]
MVNLNFADKTRQAIMKDYQIDLITSSLIHVDFQEILATEMLKIAVHIVTSGEAVGVKRDGGLLQHGIREIEIECLPDKIPGHVDVDVSPLGIGQSIPCGRSETCRRYQGAHRSRGILSCHGDVDQGRGRCSCC